MGWLATLAAEAVAAVLAAASMPSHALAATTSEAAVVAVVRVDAVAQEGPWAKQVVGSSASSSPTPSRIPLKGFHTSPRTRSF